MVLQRYLTQLILSYARKYIRNIEANLNISLWGGDVVLNNLDIRLDGQCARLGESQSGILDLALQGVLMAPGCLSFTVLQRELGVPREFEFSRGFIKESAHHRAHRTASARVS
jgi:hypothetical protein